MFRIYVGNLSFHTTVDAVHGAFAAHGEVLDVFLGTDRETGRPRGFGFVTMADREHGLAAIAALNGKDFEGRALVVSEAQPRAERPAGRSFGGGGARSGPGHSGTSPQGGGSSHRGAPRGGGGTDGRGSRGGFDRGNFGGGGGRGGFGGDPLDDRGGSGPKGGRERGDRRSGRDNDDW